MTEWITTAEASKLSGYTQRRIRQLAESEQILGQKFGDMWQVDRASLTAYIRKAKDAGAKRGPKPEN